ncbi:MAP kinase [Pseudozyma hubeiensis SY62]|uniref:Mitogen-activated protein kinase n=1 Tax=Pseudozyma hubeiensis (strain SY62) TaxID=1305764 RepID=R9P7U2_PSEHS|nr:MAP kinase [Pseudozyma hubeiensis SY62]GAC97394.1 MAP kinase [Pseudozyma hubeiensis SY62]
MPAPQSTPLSPPPQQGAAAPGSSKTPPPPSPPSSSTSNTLHQVGSRQGTRSRTRTRRNMSSSASGSHRTPRYTNEDHPMAPHNLAARGYHSFRCLGVPFHVKQRYTFVRELGIGAYGCVALCRDEVLECNVAIKKVTRIFEKDVLARRALREVALLRHIGMCDNVTALLDFDTAFIDFSEIYLVLSASEADLSQIIRSGQALSDAHHQYFMAQILRGVRYMHAAKVIHRDLKPSNLLVNGDCALRICDFGLARAYADSDEFLAPPSSSSDDAEAKPRSSIGSSVDGDHVEANQSTLPTSDAASSSQPQVQPRDGSARSPSPASDLHVQLYKTDSKGKQKRLNYPGGPLTGYVATRWYRAPEVMLCFREGYGPEMDMWSVGCILAELIAGAPIFGGKDYVDQIARINNVLGSPSEAVLDKIGSERAKTYIKSLPNMPAVPLEKLYPNANPEALDLVAKLLTWDPDQRLTAEEALRHPWLKAYHESNARWQVPQPFSKFAEVEFIHSLRQFKTSLQREADEMRLELEELEREEMEHLGNGVQNGTEATATNGNGEHRHEAHQNGEQPSSQQSNGTNGHVNEANVDADEQAHADSGNVQGADDVVDHSAQQERRGVDADAPYSDLSSSNLAKVDNEARNADADADSADADALSCSASTQSGHPPVDTASSSSSIHTPSSTSVASADEAEPASPRMYEACRMSTALKSRAEHLEEGKALRKPPSFFRLGHEAEGRTFGALISDEEAQQHNVAFMPSQVLTVARGLVEYQSTAAAAMRDAAFLPSLSSQSGDGVQAQPRDAVMLSRSSTIKALAASDSVSGGGGSSRAPPASLPSSSTSGVGGRASGAASTPSLAQSLLDDTLFAPADGSSSGLKSANSQRHGKQLVILQDSIVQSSVSLVRELIARSTQRNQAVLLVSTLRQAETYLDGIDAGNVASIDATLLGNTFAPNGEAIKTSQELIDRITAKLAQLNANVSKTTVIIDSLNAIAHAEATTGGIVVASRVVRETLALIGGSSRLVVGLRLGGVDASTSAGLLSSLHSPLIWGNSAASTASSAAGAGGTVLSVTVHSPALLRHVFKQYSLKPPSTSSAVKRVLGFDAGEDGEEEVDARFWDVLRNVANRGPMGVAGYEAGGGVEGWWNGEGCGFEALCEGGMDKSGGGPTAITLADVLGQRTGYAVLELHYQSKTGKKYEELVGFTSESVVVPLDMTDRSSASTAATTSATQATATAPTGDAHSSMISTLPFNLAETQDQRARREFVPLPYAYHQQEQALRGNTGNASIFFEPEEDDDEDEDDPDDDLDL